MADFGRIHAFAVTNRSGCVTYERFYDRLSEVQKAEFRNAMGQCSRDVAKMNHGQVGVGNFRCACGRSTAGASLQQLVAPNAAGAPRTVALRCRPALSMQGRNHSLPAHRGARLLLRRLWRVRRANQCVSVPTAASGIDLNLQKTCNLFMR